MMNISYPLTGLLMAFMAADLAAGEWSLKKSDKAPPKELAEAIQETLQSSVVQAGAEEGEPVWEFWLTSTLPLKSKPDDPGKAVRAIAETTVMGAARLHSEQRDYRDEAIKPGVYSIRFGLQPADGDHLGTSTYPYFAVLIPASRDPKPDAITDYDSMVEASGAERASAHPIILAIFPASSDGSGSPKLTEPESDHKAIRLQVPARVKGEGEEVSAVFDLVIEGIGHI